MTTSTPACLDRTLHNSLKHTNMEVTIKDTFVCECCGNQSTTTDAHRIGYRLGIPVVCYTCVDRKLMKIKVENIEDYFDVVPV